MFVGVPTVKAILGNRVIPGLLDRHLGRVGYDSQQHNGPADPNRKFNLWHRSMMRKTAVRTVHSTIAPPTAHPRFG
jgi:hypothetical protein